MPTLLQMNPGKQGLHARIQLFSFKAPTASRVQLVGDFTHWERAPINLRKDPDNIWRTKVQLSPGQHRYRFLVDGQWRDDPECATRLPNPFGSEDDICQVA